MANTTYVFERMSPADAANFDGTDSLVFIDSKASDLTVTNAAATGLTAESITISRGAISLTFPATGSGPSGGLSQASQAGNLTSALDSSNLIVGSGSADTTGYAVTNPAVFYTFGGDDTLTVTGTESTVIHGGDGADGLTGGDGADFIFGGLGSTAAGAAGADTIDGGDGNDHLYGGDFTAGVTSTDGADSIDGGDGNDYVQGNAGNDTLFGSDGEDRINGGAGGDSIEGGNGFDTINGNQGDDLILGDAGNDSLRGGAGKDQITGGDGQDIILGDLGDDSINGGVGIDQVTGGDGADVFSFTFGDSVAGSNVTAVDAQGATVVDGSGAAVKLTGFYDTITDFTHGTDKIDFATVNSAAATPVSAVVLKQAAGATFSTAEAAQVYAQQLLDNRPDTANTHEVAAIQVVQVGSSDTYLFSNENGGPTINSVIHLTGVNASTLDTNDFI